MEKETKVPAEDPKIDLFEDDDEFEEFEINEVHYCEYWFLDGMVMATVLKYYGAFGERQTKWDEKEEGKETTQQWEDDWDDDDVNDDFSLQLRKELENNTEKS
ncbi:DSS1/SEM1-like protein [Melia azedarach]|uniref:DSS1/SEM1-like protein n=1 Tax=Melia azedarach TaxID=155640 RepID=A0ACC1Z140_MELAZ|nr:DSS1/SEM1-like protein [Melia azedarach]